MTSLNIYIPKKVVGKVVVVLLNDHELARYLQIHLTDTYMDLLIHLYLVLLYFHFMYTVSVVIRPSI